MNSQISKTISFGEIARAVNGTGAENEMLVFNNNTLVKKDPTYPFQVDAAIFAVCTKGEARITIDMKEYEVRPNCIITLQPNNYVVASDFGDDFRSVVIVCSRSFLEEVLPKLSDLLPYMMRRRTSPVNQLSEEQIRQLTPYFTLISQNLGKPKNPIRHKRLVCILQAAIYEMMEMGNSPDNEEAKLHTRKEETMAKFIIAVSENFRTDRNVASYARRLFITPKHLTYIVKEMSGKTAREWIENYVIMEAKILLRNTDKNIQEIATYLNFPNQSFFGKYFKHLTGQTPTEYRREQN